jgi:putative acetyltransferase
MTSSGPSYERSISVSPYRPADTDSIIAVFQNSVRVTAHRDYSEAQVMAWAPDNLERARWVDRYSQRLTRIAELDGIPVGFADLEPEGHLDHIYVHSSHQRQGIATGLLWKDRKSGAGFGAHPALYRIQHYSPPFFDRYGFRVITPQTVLFNGEEFTNYRMEKLLGVLS